jgi:putative transposase
VNSPIFYLNEFALPIAYSQVDDIALLILENAMIADEDQQAPTETSEDVTAADMQQPSDEGRKARTKRTEDPAGQKSAARRIRRHTPEERAEKLRQIDKTLAKGGISLKAAVEALGISDQTYYQWKRAGKMDKSAAPAASPSVAETSLSLGNELAELIKLEEENQRLRQLLGEKLRAENAELRRRLELG